AHFAVRSTAHVAAFGADRPRGHSVPTRGHHPSAPFDSRHASPARPPHTHGQPQPPPPAVHRTPVPTNPTRGTHATNATPADSTNPTGPPAIRSTDSTRPTSHGRAWIDTTPHATPHGIRKRNP